jgi:predicted phosphodiesterase
MILVFSDIHGNVNALRAIIKEAHQNYQIQKYAIMGDMFTLGPAPLEVYEELEKLKDSFFIRGNHEDYLIHKLHEKDCLKIGNYSRGTLSYEKIKSSLKRTYLALGDKRIAKINQSCLEESHLLIAGIPHYFCHGSPTSNKVGIDLKEAEEYLSKIKAGCFWAGHVHHQMFVTMGDKKFINPGGSGLPFDGDQTAPYAVIDAAGQPHIHRVAYDYQKTIDQLNHFPEDLFAPFMQKRYELAKSSRHLLTD